jgi:hypothetical protein
MQQWEYLVVNVMSHSTERGLRVVTNGEPKEFPQGKGPTMYDYFRELGRDFWELVGFEGMHTYIFKRPMNE